MKQDKLLNPRIKNAGVLLKFTRFRPPTLVIFGNFLSENIVNFGQKAAKNDHSMSHGVLIKSGVLYAWIR